MTTALESELEYLRSLKDNNTKTITEYIKMVQRRDAVIQQKDEALRRANEALSLVQEKVGEFMIGPVRLSVVDSKIMTQTALNAGIKMEVDHGTRSEIDDQGDQAN